MATLTLNVPDELLRGVEVHLKRRGCQDVEQYLLSALEALQVEDEPLDPETEAKLLEGLNSPLEQMTDADWAALRQRVDQHRKH